MFNTGFPPEWSTLKKLVWLVGSGIAGAAAGVWKTVSGSLIHITDALASPMQKCEVTLEPIQDLHGQDAPYPAGGGTNKLKTSGLTYAAPSSTVFSNATARTFTENSYTTGVSANNYCQGNKVSGITVSENFVQFTTIARAYGVSIPIIGLTVGSAYTLSASIVDGVFALGFYEQDGTFISNTIGSNSGSLTATIPEGTYYTLVTFAASDDNGQATFTDIQLELGQSASPYKPFANICPITGWTGCEVNVTGVNVWDEEWELGTIDATTGADASDNRRIRSSYIPVLPNKSYRYFSSNAIESGRGVWYGKNKEFISGTTSFARGVITAPNGAYFLRFSPPISYGATYNNDISINYPFTDTDYHAYSGTTLSVTFPDSTGTVYGGTLDVVSGVLTVDWAIKAFSSFGSYSNMSGYKYGTVIIEGAKSTGGAAKADYLCDTLNVYYDVVTYGTRRVNNVAYCYFPADMTQQEATELCNGMHFVYPLATPLTYQLTPQQIATLKGENNVWSNGDSVEITYKAQA